MLKGRYRSEKSYTSSSGPLATTGNLTPPPRGPAPFCILLSTVAVLDCRNLFVSPPLHADLQLFGKKPCRTNNATTALPAIRRHPSRTSAKHITLQHPPLSRHLVIIALLLERRSLELAPDQGRCVACAVIHRPGTSTAIYLGRAVIGGGNTWGETGCCGLTGR